MYVGITANKRRLPQFIQIKLNSITIDTKSQQCEIELLPLKSVILSSNTFGYNMHTLHWTPYLQLICFQIPNIPLSRLHSYTSTLHAHSKEIPCVLSASMIIDLRHRTWTRIIKWIICEYENTHFFFVYLRDLQGTQVSICLDIRFLMLAFAMLYSSIN